MQKEEKKKKEKPASVVGGGIAGRVLCYGKGSDRQGGNICKTPLTITYMGEPWDKYSMRFNPVCPECTTSVIENKEKYASYPRFCLICAKLVSIDDHLYQNYLPVSGGGALNYTLCGWSCKQAFDQICLKYNRRCPKCPGCEKWIETDTPFRCSCPKGTSYCSTSCQKMAQKKKQACCY